MWEVAIPVAGKLLGGLFGRKSAKKAAARARAQALEDRRNQFSELRDAAHRGGFNPLSALQATGTGGFADLPSGVAPPLASADILRGITQDVGDYLTSEKEHNREAARRTEELAHIERQRQQAGGAGEVVTRTRVQTVKVPGVSPLKAPQGPTQMDPSQPGETIHTNPYPKRANRRWVNPRYSDAEHAEQRLGDVAQEVAGGVNSIADTIYTAQLRAVERDFGPLVADEVNAEKTRNPRRDLADIIREKTAGKPKSVRPRIAPQRRSNPDPFPDMIKHPAFMPPA
ncbi:MAG: hypothetical protein [Microviridae sp.]|nr:MAG: hypothetical protein [Microviridae sp.]